MATIEITAQTNWIFLRFLALNIIYFLVKPLFSYARLYTSKAMREYQQKHMIRTLVYSRVTLVVLFLLIVLLLRSIMELNDKRIEVAKLRDDSLKEREELERKVNKAQKETDAISTERGFEAYVRTTYPVVKKGEGVIVIYDDDKVPVSPVRENVNVWEKLSIWWKDFFKK
jgi:type VI protein secretion system component VasK